MWRKELSSATIAAEVVGMEALGRDGFDARRYTDCDVILMDESHNFRNDKSNRHLALDSIIQLNGGRGRDGERKKLILLSATPINNDLYGLASQIRLFTQSQPDYFREAGVGDFNSDGEGHRHFWRYIDAATHEIKENRYEIAQLISCLPDEPRYIGDQDVFQLQEKSSRASSPTNSKPSPDP